MMKNSAKWRLRDWLAFESLLARRDETHDAQLLEPNEAVGSTPSERRRAGLRAWLLKHRDQRAYDASKFLSIFMACGILLAAISGTLVAFGCFHHDTKGLNVIVFLSLALLLPWLLFIAGALVFCAWQRNGTGLFGVWLSHRVIRKLLPHDTNLQVPSRLLRALGLRAASMMQIISATYHIAAATGLSALCMIRHVTFFWESTTTTATADALTVFVKITAYPWKHVFPQALPSVADSRWSPAMPNASDASWWTYLVLTLLVWGFLPRLLMAIFFRIQEHRTIAQETFQGEQHKQLWRAIEPERRTPLVQGLQDDALVIDVCGINPDAELLRPALLQRLRLNPTAWASAGNLDENRRKHCADAIQSASGAIVLLAPAELLSPGEMRHLIANIRQHHAKSRIILFAYRFSGEVTEEECNVWKNFADSLNDANLEVAW